MRYLLLIALLVVGVLLWRRAFRRDPPREVDAAADRASESMVQCRVCGVYLPLQESLTEGPFHYCSEAHRQQDRSV